MLTRSLGSVQLYGVRGPWQTVQLPFNTAPVPQLPPVRPRAEFTAGVWQSWHLSWKNTHRNEQRQMQAPVTDIKPETSVRSREFVRHKRDLKDFGS